MSPTTGNEMDKDYKVGYYEEETRALSAVLLSLFTLFAGCVKRRCKVIVKTKPIGRMPGRFAACCMHWNRSVAISTLSAILPNGIRRSCIAKTPSRDSVPDYFI